MGNTGLIIVSVIFGLLAVLMFLVSYRQHNAKGFIFTNTWLFASKKEREDMDERIKKYEYKVARNVFFILGVLFSLIVVSFYISTPWLWTLIGILVGVLCVYAIIQYIIGERLRKSIEEERKSTPKL